MSHFILKNGTFLAAGEKLFTVADTENLLFSERIRAIRNSFPFFADTIELLLLKFRIFNQPAPDILLSGGKDLKRQMERLLVKNKLYKSAIVSVCFFRNGPAADYILSAGPLDTFEFELKNKGLLVDVFDKMPKAISGLSNLSVGSEAVWKVAASHLPGSGYDEFLLINSDEKIIEGTGKKLFLIKNDQITGVSASAGAYMDVSGVIVPALAKMAKLSYSETDGFAIEQLYQADELLLTDAVYGFHSILGFREKRYYSLKTREMNAALNDFFTKRQ